MYINITGKFFMFYKHCDGGTKIYVAFIPIIAPCDRDIRELLQRSASLAV